MKTIIDVQNVTKIFGKGDTAVKALDNINLKINEGETVAIIGKSGSGKSTLMHLLALLDRPTEGKIIVGGQDSAKLSAGKINALRNRKFGFVFQQFFMNANDTVFNNVLLPLKIAKVGYAERRKRAEAALKTVELEKKVDAKANDLSGGQKQRVCIARAIVNKPEIIFADEPTGNLDSTTGDKITELLFNLNKKDGVTLIIVTHDEDLAKKCGRIVRIKDGKIVSDAKNKGGKKWKF